MRRGFVHFTGFGIAHLFFLFFLTPLMAGDDLRDLKIDAIQYELDVPGISIQPVGSGDDVMLEGNVSSREVRDMAKSIAGRYFDKVFEVLSVQAPTFQHQCHAYILETSKPGITGSRYVAVLQEGQQKTRPWYFLLFDDKELGVLRSDLEGLMAARHLGTIKDAEAHGSYQGHFSDSGNNYLITLDSQSLDNGYYRCNVKVSLAKDENQQFLFNDAVYCRNGEWIALTGFSELLTADKESGDPSMDLLIFIQPDTLRHDI